MSFEPVRIAYQLNRRQQWAAHFGVWMRFWPALVGVTASLVAVLVLSFRSSLWFLLLLCLPVPPFNNIPRLLAGFLNPFLYGKRALDIRLEEDRLSYSAGTERQWIPLSMVDGVHRFRDDTWTISFSDGPLISIPVAAIEEKYIQHVRAKGRSG